MTRKGYAIRKDQQWPPGYHGTVMAEGLTLTVEAFGGY